MRFLFTLLCIILLSHGCSHTSSSFTMSEEDGLDGLDYALVDTDSDRYIVYNNQSGVIDEDGAEDLRVIATSYDKWPASKVIVRSSQSSDALLKVEKMIALLERFGVDSKDIVVSPTREELILHDHIVHVSVDIGDDKMVYAEGF